MPFDGKPMRSVAGSALAALMLTAGCGMTGNNHGAAMDLAPYRKMADRSECADIQNDLFLIDRVMVLWRRSGECHDASYRVELLGKTVDESLCVLHDSIAGPVRRCADPRFREMFDTMVRHEDKPDLGLGPGHAVIPVER